VGNTNLSEASNSRSLIVTAKDHNDTWEPGITYVIGHQHPDTDAVAAALGHAWYLNALGDESVRAARAGELSEQTLFALERSGQAAPQLLTDAAPTFGHAAQWEGPVAPEAPLSDAIAKLSEEERVVPVVEAEGRPLGVVTPLMLARASSDGPDTLRRPCRNLVEMVPTFSGRVRVSDHRDALMRGDADEFLVIDDAGRYLGMVTRGRLLEPPQARLILVDHNEITQAVPGAEEAEIVAVLDHHRLGNPPTAVPIPFTVEPVGSTSTLVVEQCCERALELPVGLAGTLLSGILSDTLVFRSPTTTERDRGAADWLAGVTRMDVLAYGEELLRAGSRIAAHPAGEIVDADRKTMEFGGKSVSIGQVEVVDLHEVSARREELLTVLEERREREALALVCLMITDVIKGQSHLICRGDAPILALLPFTRVDEHEYDLGEMVSRKQQLVPALHDALEGTY
jgi:manganese-dependent inorganic pyrophosphatase